jgi:hypothetical protein
MVWSATTKLGCGKATTADGKTDFVVCDYNPRGNMVGQSPFKTLPSTTPKATAECEACGKKVQDLTAQVEKLKQEIAAAFDQKLKDDMKIGMDLLVCNLEKTNANQSAEKYKNDHESLLQSIAKMYEGPSTADRIMACILKYDRLARTDEAVKWCFIFKK